MLSPNVFLSLTGKTNPCEWAHNRGNLASGWSGRGGQTTNPYFPNADPCGSSSGSGVAAAIGLATVTLGTETDGSIICPASHNNVVGIKPTVGLTSRSGGEQHIFDKSLFSNLLCLLNQSSLFRRIKTQLGQWHDP